MLGLVGKALKEQAEKDKKAKEDKKALEKASDSLLQGKDPIKVGKELAKQVIPYGSTIIDGVEFILKALNIFSKKEKTYLKFFKYESILPLFGKGVLQIRRRNKSIIKEEVLTISALHIHAETKEKLEKNIKSALKNPELFVDATNNNKTDNFNQPVIAIRPYHSLEIPSGYGLSNGFSFLIDFLLGRKYQFNYLINNKTTIYDIKPTLYSIATKPPEKGFEKGKDSGWIDLETITINGKVYHYTDYNNIKAFIALDPKKWEKTDPRDFVLMTIHNISNNPSKSNSFNGSMFATGYYPSPDGTYHPKYDAFGLDHLKGNQYNSTNITNLLNLALGLPSSWEPKIPKVNEGTFQNVCAEVKIENIQEIVENIQEEGEQKTKEMLQNELNKDKVIPPNKPKIVDNEDNKDKAEKETSIIPLIGLGLMSYVFLR